MIIPFLRQELKEVLMDPKAPGVKEPYFIIKGEASQNITVISPGKNGMEFNKTYGYFHTFPGVEIYHVVYGQGVLLMQRNDDTGEAKEVRIISLRSGITVEVPAGYGHCLVNIGKVYLVVLDQSAANSHFYDTEAIRQKRGFAYYVVDKKGEIGFEANPNYKLHPQIATG